jgi:hypothetical protein
MKRILGIVTIGLLLSSCGTPGAYYSYQSTGHKAAAESWDGGYGGAFDQPTEEMAVFIALENCLSMNASCYIVDINGRSIGGNEASRLNYSYSQKRNNYIFEEGSSGIKRAIKKKAGVTYKNVGSMVVGSDGTSYRSVGDRIIGSDGSWQRTIGTGSGSRTIYSDGTSSRTIGTGSGSRTIYSDGTSSRTIGTGIGKRTINSSTRTSCRTVGTRTICTKY